MNQKQQLSALVKNPMLIEAMDKVFTERKERLNEAVQELDNALGDCDPAVLEAVEAFIQKMWKEF